MSEHLHLRRSQELLERDTDLIELSGVILSLLKRIDKENNCYDVVDIGCGNNALVAALTRLKLKAIGLDRDATLLDSNILRTTPEFIKICDINHGLPFEDESVGILFISNLLDCSVMNIGNPNNELISLNTLKEECNRVLVPGGSLHIGFDKSPAKLDFQKKLLYKELMSTWGGDIFIKPIVKK